MSEPQRQDVEGWKQSRWSKLPAWARWTIGVVGALILLGIGAAIGSSEEDDLKSELALVTKERNEAEGEADALAAREQRIIRRARATAARINAEAQTEGARISSELRQDRSELSGIQAELDDAESSLAGAEHEEALSSFGDGIWQAETDFTPGTYRSAGGDGCYYATLGSADTSDIITNEITLDASQQIVTIESPYFQSKDCGTWERINE